MKPEIDRRRVASVPRSVGARPSTMVELCELADEFNMTRAAVAEIALRCFFQTLGAVESRDEFMADCRNFVKVKADGRLARE